MSFKRTVIQLDLPAFLDGPSSFLFASQSVIFSQARWLELGKWLHTANQALSCPVQSNIDPKEPRVVHQDGHKPSTATTDPEARTEEDEIDIVPSAASLELADDARAALMVLTESKNLVCYIHILNFLDLVEEHEVDFGKSLEDAVDLTATDPL